MAAHILEGIWPLLWIIPHSPGSPAPLSPISRPWRFSAKALSWGLSSILRLFAILISVFLPAVWLLLANNKEFLPEYLHFIGVKQEGTVGLGLQFILASLGIDLIRMASIQTPDTLATSSAWSVPSSWEILLSR